MPLLASMPFAISHAAALGAQIRASTAADLEFLATLYRTTREEEMDAAGMPEPARALFALQQFAAQQRDFATRFDALDRLIILQRTCPVGRLDLHINDQACRIVDISLLPETRGQGLGTAILLDLIAHAGDLGKPLQLSVRDDNRAQRLYARLGFKQGRTRNGYIEMQWQPRAV